MANAVENILSQAKRAPPQTDWRKKRDYGKTPEYIHTIRKALSDEYKMISTLKAEQEQKKYLNPLHRNILSEEEINQLRQGLKRKWEITNNQYQKITHVRVIDTLGLRRKKLNLERELAEIERDIKKLNKAYILVEGA